MRQETILAIALWAVLMCPLICPDEALCSDDTGRTVESIPTTLGDVRKAEGARDLAEGSDDSDDYLTYKEETFQQLGSIRDESVVESTKSNDFSFHLRDLFSRIHSR
jgi:hypothetical protein